MRIVVDWEFCLFGGVDFRQFGWGVEAMAAGQEKPCQEV
jgi:hypothetical protein